MSWFSGIGHAIGGAFRGVDKFANKINPLHHFMDQAANVAGDIWKPLGKAGHWGNNHPAEAAAIAATAYFGGAALGGLGDAGAGAGAGAGTGAGLDAGAAGAAEGAGAAAGEGGGLGGWFSGLGGGSAAGGSSGSSFFSNIGLKLAGSALGGSGGSMSGGGGGGGSGGGSGVDWSGVIGGLGSLYSGISANHQASGLQGILNNAYSFNDSRPMYANELNQLMADPEKAVTSSPGYKAEMDQALQASERTAASQGLTGSGTEAAALTQTGANLEQGTYNNLFSQLSMLSGATLDPSKMFSEQMSVDQTKQGGSSGVFSGLSSAFGSAASGSGSGSSGGGLGSWFSGLFGGGGGSAAVDNGSINLFADAAGG